MRGDGWFIFVRGGFGGFFGRFGGVLCSCVGVGCFYDDDDVLNYRVR